jgi:hypothetical protein
VTKEATSVGNIKAVERPSALPFASNRQELIHRRLEWLVGPGPAAFFKDACRLMDENMPLENTAHMAGHAMREVESALREVMLPDDFQTARCSE